MTCSLVLLLLLLMMMMIDENHVWRWFINNKESVRFVRFSGSISICIALWTTCEMRDLRGDLSGAGKGAGIMKLCSPVFRK